VAALVADAVGKCKGLIFDWTVHSMDAIVDLLQWWRISSQVSETATLQERVENLERQLLVLRQIITALVREQRPELQELLGQPGPEPPWPAINPARWCLVRQDALTANHELLPGEYSNQAEADEEAQKLLRADAQARIFVFGPQGQRYRKLP
jgi:hypothetical protein